MIKKILKSQKINEKPYYYVQWNRTKKPSAWVTADDYPEIHQIIQKNGLPQQGLKNKLQNQKKAVLAKDQKPDYNIFKEKVQKKDHKRGKNKRQNYTKKLQREGVQKYKLTFLQRLEKIIEKLTFEIERPTSSLLLDYQIQQIQAVFKTKTNQICFIVNLVGKNQKFSIPLKKMKKYFPRSLKNYLQELVSIHKFNQGQQENEKSVPFQGNIFNNRKQSKLKNKRKPQSFDSEIDSEIYHQSSSPKPSSKKKSSKGQSPFSFEEQESQKSPTSRSVQKRTPKEKGSASPIQFDKISRKTKKSHQIIQQEKIQQPNAQKFTEMVQIKPRLFSDIFSEFSDSNQS